MELKLLNLLAQNAIEEKAFPGGVLISGNNKKDSRPRKTVMISCDVHTIQPKAFPASNGMWYKNKILAINIGKNPKPPLVKAMVKLPITKATNAVPKVI